MPPKPKPKPKTTPKGWEGKLNKEVGLGPLKLPLWGWGAVGIGALWFYLHFIRGSQTAQDTSTTDLGTGGSNAGGMGPGAGGGGSGGAGGGRGRNAVLLRRLRRLRRRNRALSRRVHRLQQRRKPNPTKSRQRIAPRHTINRARATEHTATTRRINSGTLGGNLVRRR